MAEEKSNGRDARTNPDVIADQRSGILVWNERGTLLFDWLRDASGASGWREDMYSQARLIDCWIRLARIFWNERRIRRYTTFLRPTLKLR